MNDLADYIAKTMHGARQYTFAENPGPIQCRVCKTGKAEPKWVDWYGRWFRLNTCQRCIDQEQAEEDRKYVKAQQDEWLQMALAKSGLHGAELTYDRRWMRPEMKGCTWPTDQLTESERGLPNWRYVWGKPGTGTTTQIVLAVRWYTKTRRKRCLMISCAQMLETLRPDGGHKPLDYIEQPLLAIDKFGQGLGSSDWGGEQLLDILEERKRRHLPTLFASTMPLQEIDESPDRYQWTIQGHPRLQDGRVAATIWSQVYDRVACGMRGVVHLTQPQRPVMSPTRQTTRQQRMEPSEPARRVRRQMRDEDVF